MEIINVLVIDLYDALSTVKEIDCYNNGVMPTTTINIVQWTNHYGNQEFCKDSLHIFCFNTINGEPFENHIEEFLYNLCYDAIQDHKVVFQT